MNVATTSSAPSTASDRTDQASGPTRIALGTDHDSVDTPVETDGTVATAAAQPFGKILQDSMAAGDPAHADPHRFETEGERAKGVTDLVDASADAQIASGAKARKDDPTTDRADAAKIVDTAGTDLAAQLALVSQWAGIARPPPATTATADAAANGAADGLDIAGKLSLVRPTSSKQTSASTSAGTIDPSLVVAQTPGGNLTVATAAGIDRDTRFAARARIVDAKGDAADAANATDARASRIAAVADALLAGAGATTGHDASTPDSSRDGFAQLLVQSASETASRQPLAASGVALSGRLDAAVGTSQWSHEVGQAALRMAANDLQTASLRLNPEHLGPLDVQVRIDNGTAHLSFGAAHAETRQAIESSRTTLDQLFAEQGLKIGDCAVGDSSSRRGLDAGAANGDASRGRGGDSTADGSAAGRDDAVDSTVTIRKVALGLVDTFA